jgi:hypothetical protein
MKAESIQLIRSCICADVHNDQEIGWEEVTEAALIDLLRGELAQTKKERAMLPSMNGPLTQCDTLKMHLKLVLERLSADSGPPKEL